jgi:hypothetical protein
MKKIFAFVLTTLFFAPVFAQSKKTGPEITFEETTIDYGKIEEKSDGARTFVFRNTGNEPLIIERAQPTCGCTVPEWTREPIMPGKEGRIQVTYDTKRIGHFNKSIKIYSNASNSDAQGVITLRIRGEIEKIPDTPTTPLNNSGNQSSIRNK